MSGDNTLSEEVANSNLDNDGQGQSSSEPKEELSSQEKVTLKEEKKKSYPQKVDILFKAAGDAPIMKSKKWSVESERTVGSIIAFIKRYLKLDVSESLYLYVNQCFAPSPDQIMLNLYECFGSDGKLVLHYCKTPAWG